jgi:hypothetical protein
VTPRDYALRVIALGLILIGLVCGTLAFFHFTRW